MRRGPASGRPPAFDGELYKARNVVERCFARFKQFRAIATRFDKLAARYRAGLHLASLILWLRAPHQDHSSDRPRANADPDGPDRSSYLTSNNQWITFGKRMVSNARSQRPVAVGAGGTAPRWVAQTVPRSWTMAQASASSGASITSMRVWASRPYCWRYSSE